MVLWLEDVTVAVCGFLKVANTRTNSRTLARYRTVALEKTVRIPEPYDVFSDYLTFPINQSVKGRNLIGHGKLPWLDTKTVPLECSVNHGTRAVLQFDGVLSPLI